MPAVTERLVRMATPAASSPASKRFCAASLAAATSGAAHLSKVARAHATTGAARDGSR